MRFPSNSIIVNKSIADAFYLLLCPDTYSPLLKNEYRAKIIYDKKTPMEVGKLFKLIMPGEKGQLVANIELSDCISPEAFRLDIVSINRKKKNKEEPLPIFMLLDKMYFEAKFEEAKGGTKVVFSTYAEGIKGILTKVFAYVFFGIPSWFYNRKYLKELTILVNSHA